MEQFQRIQPPDPLREPQFALQTRANLIARAMTASGQVRKSAEVPETSAFGGEADVDFRRLDFRA